METQRETSKQEAAVPALEAPLEGSAPEPPPAEQPLTDDASPVAEAPVAEAPTAEAVDPNRKWYVVHTYAGYENKVQTNLLKRIDTMNMKDKIFQVLVPTEEEVEIRNGKKKVVQKKIFPGYVLVEMTMTDDSWYVVRNTSGVTGFVGSGIKPTPLPEEEVKIILKQASGELPRPKISLKVGEKVRIISGPFTEFYGSIQEVSPEREKIKVLVSIFGRETPVELDYGQVEKL